MLSFPISATEVRTRAECRLWREYIRWIIAAHGVVSRGPRLMVSGRVDWVMVCFLGCSLMTWIGSEEVAERELEDRVEVFERGGM